MKRRKPVGTQDGKERWTNTASRALAIK